MARLQVAAGSGRKTWDGRTPRTLRFADSPAEPLYAYRSLTNR